MMRSRWLGYVVAALAAAASAWAYPRLPPRVAIHWSLSGQPDGYGSKLLAAVLLPLMILAMRGLLSVLPRIDPKGENYPKFASTYWLIFNGVIVFFGVIHLAVLAYGLGAPVRMDRVVAAGVGVLLIVIGNYITRVEPNWFIGIRTPWTLSSDRVWRRTHRVGGWILVTEKRLQPHGNPMSGGGYEPGGLTGFIVGLPLFIWKDYRAVNLTVLLTHV
ncbi:MAG: SdpI family protein, partial [Gemmatimonadetes bacterium]|nr:SdpI family protein [Gemmatimonadota bacterium]